MRDRSNNAYARAMTGDNEGGQEETEFLQKEERPRSDEKIEEQKIEK